LRFVIFIKLLGFECHDLDVAIDTMMGFEFAQHVNKYLQNNGVSVRNIGRIGSNPERSKHLETATTKLYTLDVDFVNLRNEVYHEDSRVPREIVSLAIF
jgi:tRNA nucleotidyltransferase (CCA-adding enzyme)